jgi:predicted dehydrogenase
MFEQVASEFDQVIKGRRKPTCKLSDGYEVLRIVEAMRRSNERQCFVNLEEI